MSNTIYTVYKTTNLINNKIYIGVHATSNPNDAYLGSGILIKKSISKYGKDNFTKEILFEYTSYNEAYSKENEIVNREFIRRRDNYNLSVGGCGSQMGTITSKETRDKLSKSLTGRTFSDEHCKNISKAKKGYKPTKETLINLSKSQMGRVHSQKSKQKCLILILEN